MVSHGMSLKIEYNGSFNGMFDNFKTQGNLLTSLGNATLDLALDLKPKIQLMQVLSKQAILI